MKNDLALDVQIKIIKFDPIGSTYIHTYSYVKITQTKIMNIYTYFKRMTFQFLAHRIVFLLFFIYPIPTVGKITIEQPHLGRQVT